MAKENDIQSQFTDLKERVGALESEGLADDATITRIQKAYLSLGIKVTVKTYVHQYKFASDPEMYPPYMSPKRNFTFVSPNMAIEYPETDYYSEPIYASEDTYL